MATGDVHVARCALDTLKARTSSAENAGLGSETPKNTTLERKGQATGARADIDQQSTSQGGEAQ